MKQISLSQKKFAFVDDEDYGWLNQWKWHTYKDKTPRKKLPLNAQTDADLLREMRVHCAQNDIKIQDFLAAAIKEKIYTAQKAMKSKCDRDLDMDVSSSPSHHFARNLTIIANAIDPIAPHSHFT